MRLKKCRHCELELPLKSFTSTMAKYCENCKVKVAYKQKYERTKRQLERLKKKKRKKKTVKSLPQLKKSLQRLVNKYVKLRDENLPCISCQGNCGKWDAGHYIAQGSSGALRYNLDNIHKQGVGCNRFKHGNLIEYRIHLIDKIGLEKVEWLEQHRNDIKKWQRHEIEEMVKEFRKKIKEIE